MRLKAYYLSFQTHFKSLSSNTFSIFYFTLILQSFFFGMTRHLVNLHDKHNFQNFRYFVNCPLTHDRHSYSSWHRKANMYQINTIQCAFESLGNKLSNARQIMSIECAVMKLSHFFQNSSFNFLPSW